MLNNDNVGVADWISNCNQFQCISVRARIFIQNRTKHFRLSSFKYFLFEVPTPFSSSNSQKPLVFPKNNFKVTHLNDLSVECVCTILIPQHLVSSFEMLRKKTK